MGSVRKELLQRPGINTARKLLQGWGVFSAGAVALASRGRVPGALQGTAGVCGRPPARQVQDAAFRLWGLTV